MYINNVVQEGIRREREHILSLDKDEAIHYIAWRYRRTREVHRAHDMSDAEIDKVAAEQYERIINDKGN